MFPTQANTIDAFPIVDPKFSRVHRTTGFVDVVETFRQNHHTRAWDLVLFQELAKDLLRFTIRVGIGNVECVDAAVVGMLNDGKSGGFVHQPRLPVRIAKGHAA